LQNALTAVFDYLSCMSVLLMCVHITTFGLYLTGILASIVNAGRAWSPLYCLSGLLRVWS